MSSSDNKITGIILSGGKSCRMGNDKGLCMLGEKPMVSYGLEVLNSLCDEVLISANDGVYDKFNYPIIRDEVFEIGPLGGLFSAIKKAKYKHVLVLSCDMPFVNKELFEHILKGKGDRLAAIPQIGNFLEPTCGYYNKGILPILEEQIRKKEYRLRDLLEKAKYKKIEISNSMPFYTTHIFYNINNPKDLEEATLKILNYGK